MWAIKTADVFTGVIVYDQTSWGDMSTATHVTMDVKGSFAGSWGYLGDFESAHADSTMFHLHPVLVKTWWSAGAAATDLMLWAQIRAT